MHHKDKTKPKEKVILLFSGGLDTSFCTVYLKEQGYDVVTLTVDVGGLSEEEKIKIENKSKELGAIKHYTVDANKIFFNLIGTKIIKTNALYEGVYPHMCSDRYMFAKYAAEIAEKEGTKIVAHGCTGTGNDQVRIDLSIMSFAPHMKIIAPIREVMIKRKDEIEYLEKKGFKVDEKVKKYTIADSMFGRTISGSEIDENKEPEEDVWVLSKIKNKGSIYIELEFVNGVPVSLNGEKLDGLKILEKLNKVVGSFGYGRGLYIENETLGIKGIQAFEASGIILIINAHKALERLVLTKSQMVVKEQLEAKWNDLVYMGKYYDPVVKDIDKFIDSTQEKVTGKVKVKLEGQNAMFYGVESPFSLINEKIASYAQSASWTGKDAESFIKLYGMQQQIGVQNETMAKEKNTK